MIFWSDFFQKSDEERRDFYASHIFHERQKNSCPIGCVGCAVSASTTKMGTIEFSGLKSLYEDAYNLGVSLKITKVEGYDPVFVDYPDDENTAFADSVVEAIKKGHKIITPLCTTGSWKSERSIWQLKKLGSLSNKYRKYTYPSGNVGEAFVLSVPREIRPFANDKYNFSEHIDKVVFDIDLLTKNGDIEVLIYYNSKQAEDFDFAVKIKEEVSSRLNEVQSARAKLMVTDFNSEIVPESCMRYENSVLVDLDGISAIDPVTMEWEADLAKSADKTFKDRELVSSK